jgi:arylsulfatase A-like enzyme
VVAVAGGAFGAAAARGSVPRFVVPRVAALTALLFAACRAEPSERALDLFALFPHTTGGLAAARIELGRPGARAHLRSGWSAPVELPGGRSAALAVAPSASLQVAFGAPAEGELVVHCGVLGDDERAPASVRVSLNGSRVGTLRVDRGLATYTLPLRAQAQRRGLNVLTFTRAAVRRRGGSRAADEQRRVQAPAGFAIETVAFEGIDAGARAHIAVEPGAGPRLVLPPSAAVDFFLRLPRAGRLVVVTDGGERGGGRLRVALDLDDGGAGERVLFDGAPDGELTIALGDRARRLGRLTFTATGGAEVSLATARVVDVTAAPRAPNTRAANRSERPNVLLYVVDTLRADHLGCYGYPQPISPRIDALAAEGVVFSRAIAQSSWTMPATASMLTGRTPSAHGAVDPFARIHPGVVTLAEALRAHGYRTAAFVSNVNVRADLGFDRGFARYDYLAEDRARPAVHTPADELHDRVVRWLDDTAGSGPFFAYVHASEPHAPYAAPAAAGPGPELPSRPPALPADRDPLQMLRRDPRARTVPHIDYLRALYDAEVAFVDGAIGRLLDALRNRGIDDDTLLILTSDHGEEFYEHGGFEHGRTLYREQLAVPLIIRFPDRTYAGRRVSRVARQIDVLPTLLTWLDVPMPAGVQGAPLPLLRDGTDEEDDAAVEAYSETRLGGGEMAAVSTADWKVIHRLRRGGPVVEIYDLDRDPAETTNVAAERPIALGYAEQALARWATGAISTAGTDGFAAERGDDLAAETVATLRALGYLDERR